ncbi:hypothetical protein AB0A74_09725 [Saccharothrix sp. NPDC042600]|uniref:hypothetical protein n=1 Tax=Saccharothrix TaxID=2071 RepID=UPI0033FD093F|nr:hypothetical protein GCM10017745_35840 [Saccharothrix mutabilis subsp. capreolus]
MVVIVGLVVLLLVASLVGGGTEWLLVHLDITLYVVVGLIVSRWLYTVMRDRYYDWRDWQDRLAAAEADIDAEFETLAAERQRLHAQYQEDLSTLRAVEDYIFRTVRAVLDQRGEP